MAALVLGLPALLWLRPSVLLTDGHQSLLRGWLRDRRALLECGLMTLAALAAIVVVDRTGWAFPHWWRSALPLRVTA